MLALSTTTQTTEATPARALAAMLLATGRTKEERRKLDDLFPQAKQAETHLAWKGIAKGVKKLHDQISDGLTKVGDDQGVVGDAYRKASRASHRDSGASAQLAAHVAIETIAKSFVSDGTYANYAVNPDGIAHIAALVGELQHQSRGLNRALGLGGLAIDQVFFSGWRKPDAAGAIPSDSPRSPSPDRAAWDTAVATRDRLRNEAVEYELQIGTDIPADQNAALIDAEFAAYATPAPDFAAVLWKLADNMVAEWGDRDDTIEDVLAKCDSSGDLAEVVTASIYRDIQRLAVSAALPASSPLTAVVAKRAKLIAKINEMAAAPGTDTSEGYAELEKACEPLWAEITAIEHHVGAADCTGLADAAAMVEYVCQHDREGSQMFAEPLQEMLVKIGGALNAGASQVSPISTLAEELERRCALEKRLGNTPGAISDGEMDALIGYAGAVAHKVMSLSATTLEDFRVKARAASWAADDNLGDWETHGTSSEFAKAIVCELLGHAPLATNEAKLAEQEAEGAEVLAEILAETPVLLIAAE